MVSLSIHIATLIRACPIVEVVVGRVYQVRPKDVLMSSNLATLRVMAKQLCCTEMEIHGYPCCMGSGLLLLKHLPLSEIIRIHGIPAAVAVAVTVGSDCSDYVNGIPGYTDLGLE